MSTTMWESLGRTPSVLWLVEFLASLVWDNSRTHYVTSTTCIYHCMRTISSIGAQHDTLCPKEYVCLWPCENHLHQRSTTGHITSQGLPMFYDYVRTLSNTYVYPCLLLSPAWKHARTHYVPRATCVYDHVRNRHSLFLGTSIWMTPISL